MGRTGTEQLFQTDVLYAFMGRTGTRASRYRYAHRYATGDQADTSDRPEHDTRSVSGRKRPESGLSNNNCDIGANTELGIAQMNWCVTGVSQVRQHNQKAIYTNYSEILPGLYSEREP